MANSEEFTHMEAHLLLVLLLIGPVVLRPLDDVFHFRDLHVVFIQDGQDVFVEQALVQGVHIGLSPQADALKTGLFCCADPLFKGALIAQGPGTDGNRMSLAH